MLAMYFAYEPQPVYKPEKSTNNTHKLLFP